MQSYKINTLLKICKSYNIQIDNKETLLKNDLIQIIKNEIALFDENRAKTADLFVLNLRVNSGMTYHQLDLIFQSLKTNTNLHTLILEKLNPSQTLNCITNLPPNLVELDMLDSKIRVCDRRIFGVLAEKCVNLKVLKVSTTSYSYLEPFLEKANSLTHLIAKDNGLIELDKWHNFLIKNNTLKKIELLSFYTRNELLIEDIYRVNKTLEEFVVHTTRPILNYCERMNAIRKTWPKLFVLLSSRKIKRISTNCALRKLPEEIIRLLGEFLY